MSIWLVGAEEDIKGASTLWDTKFHTFQDSNLGVALGCFFYSWSSHYQDLENKTWRSKILVFSQISSLPIFSYIPKYYGKSHHYLLLFLVSYLDSCLDFSAQKWILNLCLKGPINLLLCSIRSHFSSWAFLLFSLHFLLPIKPVPILSSFLPLFEVSLLILWMF